MSDLITREFESRDELDDQLASSVAEMLGEAIAIRGSALLVVSGGSTPLNFFRQLSVKALDWSKVTVTLADERWVNPDDKDSNEKLVRENLLVNDAAGAAFFSLKTADADASIGAATLDTAIAELGTIDVVVLGMGGDGHTASLFPGSAALVAGLDMASGKSCIAVQPLAAPHQRISMTLSRLLDARQIIIHITGTEKLQVLKEAVTIEDQSRLPISCVLQQQLTPVTLYWAE